VAVGTRHPVHHRLNKRDTLTNNLECFTGTQLQRGRQTTILSKSHDEPVLTMASLLTTMYEFLNFSPSHPPQPLNPHLTFKQSSSCITINSYTWHDNEPNSACSSPCTPSRAAQLLRQELNSSCPVHSVDAPSSNARTRGQFKPQRTNKGTTSYQLRQFAEATLGSGSLRKAVKLPEGEDLNEWLAVNGKDLNTE
jgi:MOB kinase activator 1